MADNINRLMLTGLMAIRTIAPRDTGNLAFNSIIAFRTPRGVRYTQRGNSAPYGAIINAGRTDRKLSPKEFFNVGWWDVQAFGAIKELWQGNLNTQLSNKTIQQLAKDSKNTAKRDKVLERSLPKR